MEMEKSSQNNYVLLVLGLVTKSSSCKKQFGLKVKLATSLAKMYVSEIPKSKGGFFKIFRKKII